MRSFAYLFMLTSLTCWNMAACLAQPSTGPAALEKAFESDEAQEPAAAAEADAGPKPPTGTVTRAKDGVQHPDLDKAWADYDAVVAKVAESIKAAINKQFDAAVAKGDLDAAEKWQVALEKFEQAGELPTDSEIKAGVIAAVADYKKAREKLTKTYEAVVKALTREKKIGDAKVVRNEQNGLQGDAVAATGAEYRLGKNAEGRRDPGARQGSNSTRTGVAREVPNSTEDKSGQTVSFDYSTQDGLVVVGVGDASFGLKFSKASDTSIYVYKDHPSLDRVARVRGAEPGQLIRPCDIDSSSRVYAIREQEIFLAQNQFGHWLQARISSIKDDSRQDDRDQVTFEYMIYPAGQESFPALPVREP